MMKGAKGANYYYECRCGHRKAMPMRGVIGPVDMPWLNHETDDLDRPSETLSLPAAYVFRPIVEP